MKLSEKITLKTSLPMQSCIGKLTDLVDTSWTGRDQNKTIAGRITKDRFRIHKKILPRGRSAFMLLINGKIISLPTETRIVCDCGMSPTVLVLLGILLLFPVIAALATTSLLVAGRMVLQPVMIGSVIGLLFYYGFFAHRLSVTGEMRMADQKYLMAQIMDAVHAEVIDDSGSMQST